MRKSGSVLKSALHASSMKWPVVMVKSCLGANRPGCCYIETQEDQVKIVNPDGKDAATVDPQILQRWIRKSNSPYAAVVLGDESCAVRVHEAARAMHYFGSPDFASDHHNYYLCAPPLTGCPETAEDIFPGVDFLGSGYLLVIPPYKDAFNHEVKWVTGPADASLPDLPAFITELICN